MLQSIQNTGANTTFGTAKMYTKAKKLLGEGGKVTKRKLNRTEEALALVEAAKRLAKGDFNTLDAIVGTNHVLRSKSRDKLQFYRVPNTNIPVIVHFLADGNQVFIEKDAKMGKISKNLFADLADAIKEKATKLAEKAKKKSGKASKATK